MVCHSKDSEVSTEETLKRLSSGEKPSGNKMHLVKWDIVFEAKNLRGLGLRGLEILNDTFLANGCEGFLWRTIVYGRIL